MNILSNSADAAAYSPSRLAPLGTALLLGLFIIGFMGFAQIEVVHNAGHDYRHSMAFPCH
jgi:cobalt transporter subunit CbtB